MIDWSRIRELRDEIGHDDFQEVVELFLSEVEETLETLEGVSGDARQLEEKMHFLKGSALNLGFVAMSGMCQEGETAAAAGNAEAVDVHRVIATFAQSRIAFLQELPTVLAA
ncbi:Hpt domain-containing protein [Puniceibacterium sediminis]|uniref:HPt (Histidine-containing phosphotransfer) domain-containing protein n=1 Tax=Puniceibacterium sediminis TaxID=1608407 RepID=A0A238VRC2_9RHOB|nr:Hpt domain-containing protein [Puniceibacterium sediminis]SNR36786.1 HPt (histidine-containing phosphotransfer) domain-containing protein [Puniceibacterium sediminis]